jgi:outer membrane immunogenic protein
MKKQLSIAALATMAAFAWAGSANAADMPVKAAPPPIPVVYDWSGLYVGVHEGWMWGDAHEVQTNPGPFTEDSTLSNGIAGVHIGFQRQFTGGPWGLNWVLGVEGSLNEPLKRNDTGNFATCFNPAFRCGLSNITEDWTVGGRLGLAFNLAQGGWLFGGDYLLTVSGGYVSAMFKRADVNGAGVFCVGGACTEAWHNGAYVGAGIEHMVAKGVLVDYIVGFDYQHQFFDSQTDLEILGAVNHNIQADIDMVRFRTTLKFK